MGYLHKSPTWQQMQVNDSHQSNVMVIDEYVTLTPMQWLNQLSRHFVRKPSYITNPIFNSNQVFFLSICQLEILVVPIRHAHFQLVSDSLSLTYRPSGSQTRYSPSVRSGFASSFFSLWVKKAPSALASLSFTSQLNSY